MLLVFFFYILVKPLFDNLIPKSEQVTSLQLQLVLLFAFPRANNR